MLMALAIMAALEPEALFAAIKAQDAAQVEKLLAADPSLAGARRKDGLSAFMLALVSSDGEGFIDPQKNAMAAAILARRPALDRFDAAAAGDAARVRAELARDPAFVRAVQERTGWTPLHAAAFAGREEVAGLLLDAGAEVDALAKNKFANTPLQVGLLTAQVGMTRLLLQRGAKADFRNAEGITALHEAAFHGIRELIELLLAAGADVNARSKDGQTPLGLALKAHHDDAARLLRDRGAKG